MEWKQIRWILIGAAILLLLLPLLATFFGTYWLHEPGPPRDRILVYLPELKGEPLAIDPPGRIGVLGTTHPITTGKRDVSSHSVSGAGPGNYSMKTTTITYTQENVKVEGAPYEGQREYSVKRGEKTYSILLSWREGQYTVRLDGRKIRRKFFSVF